MAVFPSSSIISIWQHLISLFSSFPPSVSAAFDYLVIFGFLKTLLSVGIHGSTVCPPNDCILFFEPQPFPLKCLISIHSFEIWRYMHFKRVSCMSWNLDSCGHLPSSTVKMSKGYLKGNMPTLSSWSFDHSHLQTFHSFPCTHSSFNMLKSRISSIFFNFLKTEGMIFLFASIKES